VSIDSQVLPSLPWRKYCCVLGRSWRLTELVPVVTLPLVSSTTTQGPPGGHETPPSQSSLALRLVAVQADAPPVGLVEETAFPLTSTATQSCRLEHETLLSQREPSTSAAVQADVPPVGLVAVTAPPSESTATQRRLLGQETAYGLNSAPMEVKVQAEAPPVGLVEVTTSP
jgi:hypothetical protein